MLNRLNGTLNEDVSSASTSTGAAEVPRTLDTTRLYQGQALQGSGANHAREAARLAQLCGTKVEAAPPGCARPTPPLCPPSTQPPSSSPTHPEAPPPTEGSGEPRRTGGLGAWLGKALKVLAPIGVAILGFFLLRKRGGNNDHGKNRPQPQPLPQGPVGVPVPTQPSGSGTSPTVPTSPTGPTPSIPTAPTAPRPPEGPIGVPVPVDQGGGGLG